MKQKVLAKHTGLFKIKFGKNVMPKYICPWILFAVLEVIY